MKIKLSFLLLINLIFCENPDNIKLFSIPGSSLEAEFSNMKSKETIMDDVR